jgi:hypothetical protein
MQALGPQNCRDVFANVATERGERRSGHHYGVVWLSSTFSRTWLRRHRAARSRPRESGDLRHLIWPRVRFRAQARSCERGYFGRRRLLRVARGRCARDVFANVAKMSANVVRGSSRSGNGIQHVLTNVATPVGRPPVRRRLRVGRGRRFDRIGVARNAYAPSSSSKR